MQSKNYVPEDCLLVLLMDRKAEFSGLRPKRNEEKRCRCSTRNVPPSYGPSHYWRVLSLLGVLLQDRRLCYDDLALPSL